MPNSTAFNLGTTISMLAWVKMPSFAAPWALFDNGVSGKYCPPCGMAIDVSGYIGFGVYGSQGPAACEPHFRVTSSRIIPAQKWVHVAAVYDNSEVRFYIDGVGETARTVTPVTPYLPIHDLWLGGEEGPHAAPGGTLSGSQLWSRALTATEVQQAMTTGVANKAGLVGSWPLNEGTGTIAYDASGNGHSGNIVGATWQAGCPP